MFTYQNCSVGLAALLLAVVLAACSNTQDDGNSANNAAPTVLSTFPADNALQVSRNTNIIARFSEAMKVSTINGVNFKLTGPGLTAVPGTVSYDAGNRVADFQPTSLLLGSTVYTATITTGVQDAAGESLAVPYTWNFTTGTTADTTPPTVTSTNPADLATGVPINQRITAVFSEQMDSGTVSQITFTLMQGALSIAGSVSCPGTSATFIPSSNLAPGGTFSARITTAVKDLAGLSLVSDYVWTFSTGTNAAAGPAQVNLGTAGNFVILAKSGVSTTGSTTVLGDIGLSPAPDTGFTGFSESLHASGQYSTSSYVTGKLFASTYAPPTPSNMTTAVLDMETAYTDAAGRTLPDATNLGAGNIDGMTLVPGLYKWTTGLNIPSNVTLTGGANDVWIFQIAQNLTLGNSAVVTLSGGALAKNIFWQVAGSATLGTSSNFKGIVLCQTLIALQTGAVMNGRALAQTAVTLDATAISQP